MGKYVVLYDPRDHVRPVHKCDLPDLTRNRHDENNKIWWQTIVECEDCAKKWVALTYATHASMNKWVPLKWHHFKWKRNLRK